MSEKNPKDKWYFKAYVLVIAILCIGPFALPLRWANPRFSLKAKIVITALILILTWYLMILFVNTLKLLIDHYRLMEEVYKF